MKMLINAVPHFLINSRQEQRSHLRLHHHHSSCFLHPKFPPRHPCQYQKDFHQDLPAETEISDFRINTQNNGFQSRNKICTSSHSSSLSTSQSRLGSFCKGWRGPTTVLKHADLSIRKQSFQKRMKNGTISFPLETIH